MASGVLFGGDPLEALADAAEMLGNLGVALDAGRQLAARLVPVKDAAGLLDDVVVDPLLAVAVEARCAHGGVPPIGSDGVVLAAAGRLGKRFGGWAGMRSSGFRTRSRSTE